ncbi:unnamed protein product [Prorocentrum cordatum]|uniref:Uncharacterized protein n=1 Tax=Prorocentrum cordatum TaxID=2364126 RepID=A0ABN9Y0S6_9DINO|nr:unnamed protein product [Polarella glacialis]
MEGKTMGTATGMGVDLEQPLLGKAGEAGTSEAQLKLQRAVYFALFFMFVEIVGGVVASSLAIITDAAHMLSDVGGFIVSLVALKLSAQAATAEYTYGFKQAEVLGALLSIAIVWALTAVLLWEAASRFLTLTEVDAPVMFVISVVGFFVNLILMKVLGHGHSHGDGGHGHGDHGHGDGGHGGCDGHGGAQGESNSVAVQAAMAHVIGDIVQSLGVCLAAGLIWWQPFDVGLAPSGVSRWNYADPLCTVLFGVLVLLTTKGTLARTVDTLMAKAPVNMQQDLLRQLSAIEGVVQVHDLHIWSHGSSDVIGTAHIVVSAERHAHTALQQAVKVSKSLGVGHTTFQIEAEGQFADGETCGADCSPRDPAAKRGAHSAHGHDGGHAHSKGHGGHDAGHGGGCCGGHAH